MEIEYLLGDTPRSHPGRLALDDGHRVLTYGALAPAVVREAQFLRALGGLRFGLMADNGVPWAIADLALHHLVRLNVPIPPSFTRSQFQHVADDAGLDTILIDGETTASDRLPGFSLRCVAPESGLLVYRRDELSVRRPPLPEGVTKVSYTSGSTGRPKGVCLRSSTLDRASRALSDATRGCDIRRHLSLLPFSVLLENLAGIHVGLRSGITCVMPSHRTTGMSYGGLDPRRLVASIEHYRPDSLVLVPELLRVLLSAVRGGSSLARSLKHVAVGGAVVSKALVEESRSVGIPVYEGYGLSECASVVCLNTSGASRPGSVGRPLPHVKVRIAEDGEIHVSGTVMAGYLGDLTDVDRSREIGTGDIGEFDADGYLYVRGRLKSTFITSLGKNISPEWIEGELLAEPAIGCALVMGEGRPQVSAWILPSAAHFDRTALDAAVNAANLRLPDYARVRHWELLPERPSTDNGLLTGNGRLRREAMLSRFGEPGSTSLLTRAAS